MKASERRPIASQWRRTERAARFSLCIDKDSGIKIVELKASCQIEVPTNIRLKSGCWKSRAMSFLGVEAWHVWQWRSQELDRIGSSRRRRQGC